MNTIITEHPKIKKTTNSFEVIRNSNLNKLNNLFTSCSNNKAALKLFNKLLDNNLETLKEIEGKQFTSNNFSSKKDKEVNDLNKILAEKQKNKDLILEKDTLILITNNRNKNIEMYYVVYILFIILLLIIQGSIVIFK
jgi:hypothetical protein